MQSVITPQQKELSLRCKYHSRPLRTEKLRISCACAFTRKCHYYLLRYAVRRRMDGCYGICGFSKGLLLATISTKVHMTYVSIISLVRIQLLINSCSAHCNSICKPHFTIHEWCTNSSLNCQCQSFYSVNLWLVL